MARKRRYGDHRKWMSRSFALAMSIVLSRIINVVATIALTPQVDTTFGGSEELMQLQRREHRRVAQPARCCGCSRTGCWNAAKPAPGRSRLQVVVQLRPQLLLHLRDRRAAPLGPAGSTALPSQTGLRVVLAIAAFVPRRCLPPAR